MDRGEDWDPEDGELPPWIRGMPSWFRVVDPVDEDPVDKEPASADSRDRVVTRFAEDHGHSRRDGVRRRCGRCSAAPGVWCRGSVRRPRRVGYLHEGR